jgi:hypothetical protein
MRRTLIALAALAALALPSAALATTQVALGPGVVARLSYQGQLPQYRNLSLAIKRDGKQVYQHPVQSHYCSQDCALSIVPDQKPVQVVDFGQPAGPEVLLSLYTGGAHCCSVAQVFGYSAKAKTYTMAEHNFGDPGYRLERLSSNGPREFVTADDSFAYAFTDFADSGLPVQVLQLQGHDFDNVTTQFPGLVTADAARWLKAFHRMARSHYGDTVGVVAAWAADEYTLGHVKKARSFLKAQARAGHLNATLGSSSGGGMHFVSKLEAFLRKQGYVKLR